MHIESIIEKQKNSSVLLLNDNSAVVRVSGERFQKLAIAIDSNEQVGEVSIEELSDALQYSDVMYLDLDTTSPDQYFRVVTDHWRIDELNEEFMLYCRRNTL